ncbi:MAG: hypothetical protein PVF54_07255, partial [Anaerolineae bacterium]
RATSRVELVVLVLILLLAASLRLTRLGLVEFKYDEAVTARAALAVAREGRLPAVGMITSRGPRNPALMSYVLAPPFALSRDPRLAAGWVALLGVAAVGLTYWVARAFFDWRVGALAAALFAACPWAVFQSRKIWTQNLPLFTLVFAALVLTLVVRRRPWALAPALATAGCLISLHLGGIALLLSLGAILVLFHDRVRPLPLLLGVLLLLIVLSPYIIHDAQSGWHNLRGFAGLDRPNIRFNAQALGMAARVASGYHLEDLAGTSHEEFLASTLDLRWLDRLEIILFWLGALWAAWRVSRETLSHPASLSTTGQGRAVLLCWFVIPVALLTQRAPVQPHDFNLLYPVQHIIIALLFVDVADWGSSITGPRSKMSRRAVVSLIGLLIVVLIAWQIYDQEALLTFVARNDTPGGFGPPVKHALAAANRAETLAASDGGALIALLPGGEPRHDGSAAAFDVLLEQNRRRLVDGRRAVVLPARPTIYLLHPGASAAGSILEAQAQEVGPPLPLRTGSDSAYRFFRWQPTGDTALPHSLDDQASRWALRSGSGYDPVVTLLGYEWSGDPLPGGAIRWSLIWRVEGDPPAQVDLHWFNHLVGETGARWGQKDGVGLPTSNWCSADTVFEWFDIDIAPDAPPPPYFVRSGLYTYPDVVNLPLVDAAGNTAGHFVELGPVHAVP